MRAGSRAAPGGGGGGTAEGAAFQMRPDDGSRLIEAAAWRGGGERESCWTSQLRWAVAWPPRPGAAANCGARAIQCSAPAAPCGAGMVCSQPSPDLRALGCGERSPCGDHHSSRRAGRLSGGGDGAREPIERRMSASTLALRLCERRTLLASQLNGKMPSDAALHAQRGQSLNLVLGLDWTVASTPAQPATSAELSCCWPTTPGLPCSRTRGAPGACPGGRSPAPAATAGGAASR